MVDELCVFGYADDLRMTDVSRGQFVTLHSEASGKDIFIYFFISVVVNIYSGLVYFDIVDRSD